jgi:hypothetical protein
MPQPASIVTRTDRRGEDRTMWQCPNCHRVLGELVGTRLVIIVSRQWTMSQPLHDDLQQTCPGCHVVSVIYASVIA